MPQPEFSESIVSVAAVSHRFGGFQALKDLRLNVRRGDIYGLLGLNGAGKTTTLRILLGLLRRQSGEVRVFGLDPERARLEVARRIGATIEAPAFYPHLSGLANLRLLEGLSGAVEGGRSPMDALELAGIARAARIKSRKYSQGMLQRLYLAQALLGRPELIVLDEPTSNLDPQGILEVRRLVRRLNADEGLTVILSSHQLTEVEGLCNRVGILNQGRAIIEATVAELFRSEECEVEIASDRADEAAEEIRQLTWASDVRIESPGEGEPRRVVARVPRPRRAELNAHLVRAGCSVDEFRERRPTLEDYFHRRIAEDAA